MAKIRVDSSGITEIHTIMEQQTQTMQRVEQVIGQVLANLDIQIASTENIRQSLTSLKNSSTKECEILSGMSNALFRVNDEFQSTDHGLSEQARDVNYALDFIIADAASGFSSGIPLEILTKLISAGSISSLFGLLTTATMPLNLQLIFGDTPWDLLSGINDVTSFIRDAGDYSEWIEVLLDSEMFGDISDFLGDISKNDLFKVAGYLGDGKKLIDALNSGNLDDLEELSEKYLKKGVKSGIKLATGVKISGVVYSVYLDLGWNLGENAVESVQGFIEKPSLGSALSGLWNMTAGTFFDAGTGLAEDTFSFIGDVTGAGFDAEDFGNAMDYLWNHPFKSAYATGEVLVNGAIAVREAIVDGATTVGGAIVDGAGWLANKIGDSVCSLFNW